MKYLLVAVLLFVSTFTIAQNPATSQPVLVVSTLDQLQTYTGTQIQANWADTLRGGKFNLVDTAGLSIDTGTIFLSGKANKYWKRDMSQTDGVDASWFGLKGDGVTENRDLIQTIVRYLKKQVGGNVNFRDGIYLVTPKVACSDVIMLQGVKNVNFTFSKNAVIQLGTNSCTQSRLFHLDSCENITFDGINIIGDKLSHLVPLSEFNHAIHLFGCQDITIKNFRISKVVGDGIYMSGFVGNAKYSASRRILIQDGIIDSATRNGISITGGDGITIRNLVITNTKGKLPEAGIDIEPNPNLKALNITIDNVRGFGNNGSGLYNQGSFVKVSNSSFSNNNGSGLGIIGTASNTPTDIGIVNTRLDSNGVYGGFINNNAANVTITGGSASYNTQIGWDIENILGPLIVHGVRFFGNGRYPFYTLLDAGGTDYLTTFSNNIVSGNLAGISLGSNIGEFNGNILTGDTAGSADAELRIIGNKWHGSGNTISFGSRNGLRLSGNENTFNNNYIYSNSQNLTSGYANIRVDGDRNVLQSNTILKGTASNVPIYGINITATADSTVSIDNMPNGGASADAYNGTNTMTSFAIPSDIQMPQNGKIIGIANPAGGLGGYVQFTGSAPPIGYGAWLNYNAYYNGTNWIQPRGSLGSYLFSSNNHLGWVWQWAAAGSVDGGTVTPSTLMALNNSGAFTTVLKYNTNMGVSFTARSLPDKGYVDSARFNLTSITQGFLPPRMSTGQRTGIASPADGTMVHDITLHKLFIYDGTAWQTTSSSTAYAAKTATYTILGTDNTINCTSGTFTVTLPTAVSITGKEYEIINSGSGTITIATSASQTFTNITSTPTTLSLAPVGAGAIVGYTVKSTGAAWIVTAKVKNE